MNGSVKGEFRVRISACVLDEIFFVVADYLPVPAVIFPLSASRHL